MRIRENGRYHEGNAKHAKEILIAERAKEGRSDELEMKKEKKNVSGVE